MALLLALLSLSEFLSEPAKGERSPLLEATETSPIVISLLFMRLVTDFSKLTGILGAVESVAKFYEGVGTTLDAILRIALAAISGKR